MGILDLGSAPVFSLVQDIIDKIFPDKIAQAKEREDFLLQVQSMDAKIAEGQMAVNQAEAANSSTFVAGWRPFIGWVCGVAFAYKFVIQPFLIFTLVASGSTFDYHKLPNLDWSDMATVLFGLLGLGGFRSIEKVKGVK